MQSGHLFLCLHGMIHSHFSKVLFKMFYKKAKAKHNFKRVMLPSSLLLFALFFFTLFCIPSTLNIVFAHNFI